MSGARRVGKGRGAVAAGGKVYLEGAEIPKDVKVGDHVFTDAEDVVGNEVFEPVRPVTADASGDASEPEPTPDHSADPEPDETDPSRGTIDEVVARVEAGEVSAVDALAAEQAKGDKARSTLVEKLEALTTPSG